MKVPTLHQRLRGPVPEALKKKLGVANVNALPRIEKVIVNTGINRSKMDSKEMHEYVLETLAIIAGQKPSPRVARKSVSTFKVREGMLVGAAVTLRGKKMEAFLDKLIHTALPRIRDFRGLPIKLDGHGNYSIGIREHTVFPDVPQADVSRLFGLQVTITTTAEDDASAMALLKEIGIPFLRKEGKDTASDASK